MGEVSKLAIQSVISMYPFTMFPSLLLLDNYYNISLFTLETNKYFSLTIIVNNYPDLELNLFDFGLKVSSLFEVDRLKPSRSLTGFLEPSRNKED